VFILDNDAGDKADAFYTLAKELKDAGEPIDGVGIQGHYILGQIPSELQERMQALADLDLDVAITELDIRIESPTTQEELEQQATDYVTVINACLAVERCVGVTVATYTDKYSWVPGTFEGYDDAHLWDKNLSPKPAYDALIEALGSA
jgi:endo-1,4-beta-xylanase